MRTAMAHIAVAVVALAAGVVAGWLWRGSRPPLTEFLVQTDTLVVRDTIRESKPVFVATTRVDTMLVAIADTVTICDTVYMVLDREQRHYTGSDYEAWVSGYRPSLDSLYVFPETKYITVSVSSVTKNTIYLEASASTLASGTVSVSAGYRHEWRRIYACAVAGYDFISGQPFVTGGIGIPLIRF